MMLLYKYMMHLINTLRVYAILDKKSNSSLITSELADRLLVVAPGKRYFVTTTSEEKEVKFGRCETGTILKRYNDGVAYRYRMRNDPGDKLEIPTLEMVRRFARLRSPDIANEIPPLD